MSVAAKDVWIQIADKYLLRKHKCQTNVVYSKWKNNFYIFTYVKTKIISIRVLYVKTNTEIHVKWRFAVNRNNNLVIYWLIYAYTMHINYYARKANCTDLGIVHYSRTSPPLTYTETNVLSLLCFHSTHKR